MFVESGAYVVHPAAAVPSCTKKDAVIKMSESTKVQNDSMLSFGNAMSCAPIINGMVKFPKQPIRMGVIAKKIMISQCIVKILWYVAGVMIPPDRCMNIPKTGTRVPG